MASKYKPEFSEKLVEHFNRKAYEPVLDNEGNPVITPRGKLVLQPCEFPTLSSFATEIGICSKTIYNWLHAVHKNGEYKYPEFREAHGLAKDYQYKILTQGGLAGAFQGNFAIFTAKNVLGWRDKIEHEHSGSIEKKLELSDSLKELLSDLIGSGELIDGKVEREQLNVDVRDVHETSD